jgi:hypothetical protein
MKAIRLLKALVVALPLSCGAQIYDTNNDTVETFAGSGFQGYLDGQGVLTMFNGPLGIVADTTANLFVLDAGNSKIRKVTPTGTVSTLANLPRGSATGTWPLTIDHINNLLLGNLSATPSITVVQTNGILSQVSLPSACFPSTLTGWPWTSGLCVDSANNIYFSTAGGNQIYRRLTNGTVELFAGSGNHGETDGNGIFTSFTWPGALAADAADNIYVADNSITGNGGNILRRINQNRDVVTVASVPYSIYTISSMVVDSSGSIIIACGAGVAKLTASTNFLKIAGNLNGNYSVTGYANGPGSVALFDNADAVCLSQGSIFVADMSNQRIRQITFNPPTQPVLPANLQLNTYPGLQVIGTVGRTYQIQASADMTTWTTAATLLLTSSPYLWIDQNPVSGSKFYRAFLLP